MTVPSYAVKFRGFYACPCLAKWLPVYEAELKRRGVIKFSIDIYQLIGLADASANTHSKGGAFDIAQFSELAVWVARHMGAGATWHRRRSQGFDIDHAHGVLRGCPHNGPARYQLDAVDDGYNGLGYLGHAGPDDGPVGSSRTWEQGIAWAKALQADAAKPKMHLRIGTLNIPGPDKNLGNDAARVTRAADLIRAADLHAIGLNELMGPGKDTAPYAGTPSPFAASIAKALAWPIVTPTTALNENYIAINPTRARLSKQYDDTKLYAKVGDRAIPGRHITRTVLADLKTGRGFALGSTHLVNNDPEGAAAQSYLAMRAMDDATDERWPTFIVGDLNSPATMPGFTAGGLKDARAHALRRTNGDYATYAKYAATAPIKDYRWWIDRIYVPAEWQVDGWTLRLDTDTAGKFRLPRISDHMLSFAAVTEL